MTANRHHRPDPSTAERLLTGRVGADDAPPGYRQVAALLGDAGSGFPEPAGPGEAATVGAMVAAIQAEPTPQVASRRSGMLSKILAAKTIAVVSVVALSASGAAAAGGHLPDSVQGKVARAAKHVGVNLPEGKGVARVTNLVDSNCVKPADAPFAKNRGQYLKQERVNGPEALATAKASRCGMPVNSDETPGADEADETPKAPKAPKDTGKADEAPGKADEAPGKTDEDPGKADEAPGQVDEEPGKADEAPGAPADIPPVETPNLGGIGTGDTASDGANDTGADQADPAADEGSGNADPAGSS